VLSDYENYMSNVNSTVPRGTIPSPPIWGCLVIIIDCRAGEGMALIPLVSGLIRNHRGLERAKVLAAHIPRGS
jgi:hypothetical protein